MAKNIKDLSEFLDSIEAEQPPIKVETPKPAPIPTPAPEPVKVVAAPVIPVVVAPAAGTDPLAALLGVMTSSVLAQIQPLIPDEGRILDMISKGIDDSTGRIDSILEEASASLKERIAALEAPREIVIKQDLAPAIKVGIQHYDFDLIHSLILGVKTESGEVKRQNTFLVGPAGSGKSHLVHAVADAIGLPFYFISVCNHSSKADLLGYMDASGRYVRTLFREAYEHGGVFLLDEGDNGNANVLSVLNAATANGHCPFPDGMVKRHKDFALVLAANTFGDGANRKYVGRNALDAAFKDRFFYVDMGYDVGLEAAICGIKRKQHTLNLHEGGLMKGEDWFDFVQSVRKSVESLKLDAVVSPRASIIGCLMCGVLGRKWLEDGLIWKGMDAATKSKILSNIQS